MASTMSAALYDDIPYSPIRNMRSLDDDDASQWSIQVNVSSPINGREQADADSLLRDQEQEGGEEEYEEEEEEEKEAEEEEKEAKEDDDCGEEEYSELCEGLSGLRVEEKGVNDNKPQGLMPPFMGKHTRFVYNSDDELEACEETDAAKSQSVSPSVTRLTGFPTPAGKHLRFSEGEVQGEDEEEKGEKQE
uniref:Uncharacterized protein n=1 Tax=Picea sitchensis TaxID=3332 RepID=D5A8U0_PICSI|nr:unknown [Picea sitchensis]